MTDKQLIQWMIKQGYSRIFAEYIVLNYDKEFAKVKN